MPRQSHTSTFTVTRHTIQYSLAIVICLSTAQLTVAQSEPQDPHDSSKWEAAISKFEAADHLQSPPTNSILFVGSSSIRLWDLEKSFPNLVTINRGFGGSQLADSVQFIDRIVLKYKPRAVVMYAGDNDLNAGKSPERVFADFSEFVAILRNRLPDTTLHYVAVKPSIKRWKLITHVRRTNELVNGYCQMHDKLFFVDIDAPMLNEQGKPKPELFVKDGLHLNESGYRIWSKKLLESLGKAGVAVELDKSARKKTTGDLEESQN